MSTETDPRRSVPASGRQETGAEEKDAPREVGGKMKIGEERTFQYKAEPGWAKAWGELRSVLGKKPHEFFFEGRMRLVAGSGGGPNRTEKIFGSEVAVLLQKTIDSKEVRYVVYEGDNHYMEMMKEMKKIEEETEREKLALSKPGGRLHNRDLDVEMKKEIEEVKERFGRLSPNIRWYGCIQKFDSAKNEWAPLSEPEDLGMHMTGEIAEKKLSYAEKLSDEEWRFLLAATPSGHIH